MNKLILCPYCGNQADLVGGEKVYPRRDDLFDLNYYYCDKGHDPAYVGTHKGTTRPLGRLADSCLRERKRMAHYVFDPMWRDGKMTRGEAYAWLAKSLGMSKEECHIGMFNMDDCSRAIRACTEDDHD